MLPKTLIAALCLLLLAGCSTMRPAVPNKIDPPPVALVTGCLKPDDMPEGATAKDLVHWTMAWIGAYGCEKSKRTALIEAWPR
jgi:hypothetical protein